MPNIIKEGSPGVFGQTRVVIDRGQPAVAQLFTPSTQQSGSLNVTDGELASVAMQLPAISGPGGVGVGFSVSIMSKSEVIDSPKVAPAGVETINGAAGTVAVTPVFTEFTLTSISATDWLFST